MSTTSKLALLVGFCVGLWGLAELLGSGGDDAPREEFTEERGSVAAAPGPDTRAFALVVETWDADPTRRYRTTSRLARTIRDAFAARLGAPVNLIGRGEDVVGDYGTLRVRMRAEEQVFEGTGRDSGLQGRLPYRLDFRAGIEPGSRSTSWNGDVRATVEIGLPATVNYAAADSVAADQERYLVDDAFAAIEGERSVLRAY